MDSNSLQSSFEGQRRHLRLELPYRVEYGFAVYAEIHCACSSAEFKRCEFTKIENLTNHFKQDHFWTLNTTTSSSCRCLRLSLLFYVDQEGSRGSKFAKPIPQVNDRLQVIRNSQIRCSFLLPRLEYDPFGLTTLTLIEVSSLQNSIPKVMSLTGVSEIPVFRRISHVPLSHCVYAVNSLSFDIYSPMARLRAVKLARDKRDRELWWGSILISDQQASDEIGEVILSFYQAPSFDRQLSTWTNISRTRYEDCFANPECQETLDRSLTLSSIKMSPESGPSASFSEFILRGLELD